MKSFFEKIGYQIAHELEAAESAMRQALQSSHEAYTNAEKLIEAGWARAVATAEALKHTAELEFAELAADRTGAEQLAINGATQAKLAAEVARGAQLARMQRELAQREAKWRQRVGARTAELEILEQLQSQGDKLWRWFKMDVLGTLYYLPSAYWDTAWNGDQMRSLFAWADGAIPLIDPLSDYYPDDELHEWSRLCGGVSRDAALMALIPNLGTWAKSPFFYELGSTTVPNLLWKSKLRYMTVIGRGQFLWAKYGMRAWFWRAGGFRSTVRTGLTPAAWLALIGSIDVADIYGAEIWSEVLRAKDFLARQWLRLI